MKVLRTPDQRFANLPGFPYEPNYTDVPDGEGGTLRVHHVDAGPSDGPIVLCMHGQPTWSYLYRRMIPVLVADGPAGTRARPSRLRPLGQADTARGLQLQPASRLAQRVARRQRRARRDPRGTGLGRADRPAHGRREPGSLRSDCRREHRPAVGSRDAGRSSPSRQGVPEPGDADADDAGDGRRTLFHRPPRRASASSRTGRSGPGKPRICRSA